MHGLCRLWPEWNAVLLVRPQTSRRPLIFGFPRARQNTERRGQGSACNEMVSIADSPDRCRPAAARGASVVAGRADLGGGAVDRPAHNRSAPAAPLAGLDPPHALSRTLQVHSAQPNLS